MYNPFKRKSKIEFVNEIPGVAGLMPIIESKHLKHPWVNRAMQDFAKIRENPNWRNQKMMHTARCPGIFTLQRHGWILRTWQDITITTFGASNPNSFEWTSASTHGGDAVSYHDVQQYYNYQENWPHNTLPLILKINTGWRCNVPEGYYLMEMPVAHADENRFTAMPGYFSKESGPASMNVQLQWHVAEGEVLIKAGTPIAQYVLVPKEQMDMTCRDEQDSDNLWLSNLYDTSKFVKNYNEVKNLFTKKK
jgi:hypothetical protein